MGVVACFSADFGVINEISRSPTVSRIVAIVLAVTMSSALFSEDADPGKLSDADQALIDKTVDGNLAKPLKLYQAYQKGLDDAATKTLKDLDKVKGDAMKKGNLPLAIAVDAKEKEIKNGLLSGAIIEKNKDAEKQQTLATESGSGHSTKNLTVPASSNGEIIGDLVTGQNIELSYVSGKWGDGGALNNLSPDDIGTPGGCRIELITPDGTTVVVGTNTVNQPWHYRIDQSGKYLLRTCDTSPADNPGSVIYKVTIHDP